MQLTEQDLARLVLVANTLFPLWSQQDDAIACLPYEAREWLAECYAEKMSYHTFLNDVKYVKENRHIEECIRKGVAEGMLTKAHLLLLLDDCGTKPRRESDLDSSTIM